MAVAARLAPEQFTRREDETYMSHPRARVAWDTNIVPATQGKTWALTTPNVNAAHAREPGMAGGVS